MRWNVSYVTSLAWFIKVSSFPPITHQFYTPSPTWIGEKRPIYINRSLHSLPWLTSNRLVLKETKHRFPFIDWSRISCTRLYDCGGLLDHLPPIWTRPRPNHHSGHILRQHQFHVPHDESCLSLAHEARGIRLPFCSPIYTKQSTSRVTHQYRRTDKASSTTTRRVSMCQDRTVFRLSVVRGV